MLIPLLKSITNTLFPPLTAHQLILRRKEAEEQLLKTRYGLECLEEEQSILKAFGSSVQSNKHEWATACEYMEKFWREKGFEFRANGWMNAAATPPKKGGKKPPSNAAPTNRRVDPTKWEHVNTSDPKYHNKSDLTVHEKAELNNKDCNDFEKAAAIKFELNKGYHVKPEGYSNAELSSMLTKRYGKGYGKDTVKKYAAVLRACREEPANSYSMEW